jgi:hypothetical protein
MPLTSPIVLAKIVTTGNATFHPLKTLPDGKTYLEAAATLTEPWYMTIRHSQTKHKDYGVVDQHLVQCIKWVVNGDGIAMPLVVNQTVRLPRDSAFTDAIKGDTIGMTGGLLYISGERAAVLQGYS